MSAPSAEYGRLRAALIFIAQYDPRWTGAHPNNAPSRAELIRVAHDALNPPAQIDISVRTPPKRNCPHTGKCLVCDLDDCEWGAAARIDRSAGES